MFRIGEFSRLGQVTIETLRHYDTLGLLKPAQVDPFTGYRYYTAKQLLPLNRILALKELGFTLEETARILEQQVTSAQLREMLKLQLHSTERDLEAVLSRLDRLKARLYDLTPEDTMSAYEITLKPVQAETIAAMRQVVPTLEQMPDHCSNMFDTLARWLVSNKLPLGPCLTIYYNESFTREQIDTECAFIIPDTSALESAVPLNSIVVRQLPAVPTMVTTMVTDGFYKKVEGLTPAYHALAQWIETHGYRIAGPPREVFYGSAEKGDLIAEIQFPVGKS